MSSSSSRSTSSGPYEPTRLSFGVELEFLVAYVPFGWAIDDNDNENMAKAIAMPSTPGMSADWHCQDEVGEALREMGFDEIGGVRRVFSGGRESGWVTSSDPSLALPDELDIHNDAYLGVRWTSIEVQSPALWDEPESWEEVRAVCQYIQQRFWTITPHCTGLHFHVGTGPDYMSLRKLRRAATLLFAADPILAQLHHTHRKNRRYCLSNRTFTAVAQGATADNVTRALGGVVQERPSETDEGQELIISQRQRSRSPESTNSSLEVQVTAETGFIRTITRGQLAGYPYESGRPITSPCDNTEVPAPVDMSACIKELTNATSRGVLEQLMRNARYQSERPAYNFTNFTEDRYGEQGRKRTIEFRQSAGSLDADEVIAYGKAYVQICRFAMDSTHRRFWYVLKKCVDVDKLGLDERQNPETGFDVFDLLLLMDLGNTAAKLQDVIEARPSQPADDGSLTVGGSPDG